MIKKELIIIGIVLFFTNIIFAQQTNKKSDGLPRKGIIINAEGTPDIIQRQDAYDKQSAEMLQFHQEAELAKKRRDSELVNQQGEAKIKKQVLELAVTKQKDDKFKKHKEVEKEFALKKKENYFRLCAILCLMFFLVFIFIFFKNRLK